MLIGTIYLVDTGFELSSNKTTHADRYGRIPPDTFHFSLITLNDLNLDIMSSPLRVSQARC